MRQYFAARCIGLQLKGKGYWCLSSEVNVDVIIYCAITVRYNYYENITPMKYLHEANMCKTQCQAIKAFK